MIVAVVGIATVAIKAVGPVALSGRRLPRRLFSMVELLAPALPAALVATLVVAAATTALVRALL